VGSISVPAVIDQFQRKLDRIDYYLGAHGWRDRHAEGTVRNLLLGLRQGGQLDLNALLDDMRARGHDADALRTFNRLIDKTLAEKRLRPSVGSGGHVPR
jgi:hypothetical protein